MPLLLYLPLALVTFLWETILARLNLRHVRRHGDDLPVALAARLPAGHHQRVADYLAAQTRFGLLGDAVALGERLLWLFVLLPPAAAWCASVLPGPVGGGLLLATLLAVAGEFTALPLAWHETFTLEARFGFNRTTPALFWRDRATEWLLRALLGLPVGAAVLWLVTRSPHHWWLWASLFLIAFETLLLFLFPRFIAPLFNRFDPLPPGELRDRLERLAAQCHFPLENMMVMDGSKRSGHANAYFTGFGRHRRLVLYDTLLRQLNPEELAAVVAHEIGHHRARHLLFLGGGAAVLLTGALCLAARLLAGPEVAAILRLPPEQPGAALLALGLLAGPALTWLAPVGNWARRHCEYAADAYAVRAVGDAAPLRAALLQLFAGNLAPLRPHPWHSFWYDSHPNLLDRLARLTPPAAAGRG